jgi:hypothetical protein
MGREKFLVRFAARFPFRGGVGSRASANRATQIKLRPTLDSTEQRVRI